MKSNRYKAEIFTARYRDKEFQIAGTQDGEIDVALPKGTKKLRTFQLSLNEARFLSNALSRAIYDVQRNCPTDDKEI